MRRHSLLPILLALLSLSDANGQDVSGTLQKVIDRASFEFSNEGMYKEQDKWLGLTISFQGSFALRPDALKSAQPYQQIVGQNAAGEPIDVIVFLDEPLRAGQNYGESSMTLSLGERVRVFGIVQKCREVISRTGVVKVLPVLDLLIAFRITDTALSTPIYVNKDLRR